MPFDKLPSMNLQIPQVHFAPIPIPVKQNRGAEALAQGLHVFGKLMDNYSPEAKREREAKNLDYKIKELQYKAILHNPFGKSDLEDVHKRQAEQSILESEARTANLIKGKPDPNATFEGTPFDYKGLLSQLPNSDSSIPEMFRRPPEIPEIPPQ